MKIGIIELWNSWIDFCKQQIAYDFARSFMCSLIAYSVVGLGGHYILGHDARDSHYMGSAFAFATFVASALLLGLRNGWLKDLLKDMDKEVKP